MKIMLVIVKKVLNIICWMLSIFIILMGLVDLGDFPFSVALCILGLSINPLFIKKLKLKRRFCIPIAVIICIVSLVFTDYEPVEEDVQTVEESGKDSNAEVTPSLTAEPTKELETTPTTTPEPTKEPTPEPTKEPTSSPKPTSTPKPKKIKNITATYTGSTAAGTILNNSNTGISVVAHYKDGTENVITGWTIDGEQMLVDGEESTINIKYEDQECTLTVKCPETKEGFILKCQDISYELLARQPDAYKGTKVHFYGEVYQVMEEEDYVFLGIMGFNPSSGQYGSFTDDIVGYYTYQEGESKLLEGDRVDIYGIYEGTRKYDKVVGATKSVPTITIKYLTYYSGY